MDLSDGEEGDGGEVSLEDVRRFLPSTPTLVLCAYVFQDLAQSVLTRLPGNVVLAQYGFQVSQRIFSVMSMVQIYSRLLVYYHHYWIL